MYNFQIGQDQKALFAGNSLNDDIYHTVVFRRRGSKLRAIVDDDDPILGIRQVIINRLMAIYFINLIPIKAIQAK